jgi:adenosylcobyric acid synthase
LRQEGWETAILRHLRYGGRLIGICGGFQMLGNRIRDPLGLEGEPGEAPGLGLLNLETVLAQEKVLANVSGRLRLEDAAVAGYEIHAGMTTGAALKSPAIVLGDARGERPDGAVSEDGRILGTYLHGLFESPAAASALLRWAGLAVRETPDYRASREAALERLADTIEKHLDLDRIERILDGRESSRETETP